MQIGRWKPGSYGSCQDVYGLGLVTAGAGLDGVTSSSVNIIVPGTVISAWVYFNGTHSTSTTPLPFPSAAFNGTPITDRLDILYGPSLWMQGGMIQYYSYLYKVDVTDLVTGSGMYTLAGIDAFNQFNNGWELVVLYEDLASENIPGFVAVADGLDLARGLVEPPSGPGIEPVVFAFDSAPFTRTAQIASVAAGVLAGTNTALYYQIGYGVAPVISPPDIYTGTLLSADPFVRSDGNVWDTYQNAITIPPNATYVIIQAQSSTPTPADLEWILQTLTMPKYCPMTSVIGNQVWDDVNGNGVYEPGSGELGIAGVTLDLRNAAGQVIDTTTTDAGGVYTFATLVPGGYRVEVTDTGGVLNGYVPTSFPADQTSDNTNKRQPYAVNLPVDGTTSAADFGYVLGSSIGGHIWEDLDRNGVQDVGEPDLSGVTIELFDDVCGVWTDADTPVATVTNGSGLYDFADLPAGDYCLAVDETSVSVPAPVILTSNVNPVEIIVGVSESLSNIDFGYTSAIIKDQLNVGVTSPCTDITWLEQIAADNNGAVTRQSPQTCNFLVEAPEADMINLRATVENDAGSQYTEYDQYFRGMFTPAEPDDPLYPNDPYFSIYPFMYAPRQINAPTAWETTLGDPDLIVAVLDSGLDLNHVEFTGRIVPGWDYVNDDNDPSDDHGHGTHAAGIIAAEINNGQGLAGIAGNVKVLPVKVLGPLPDGGTSGRLQ